MLTPSSFTSIINYCLLLNFVPFVVSQLVPEESLARGCRGTRGQYPHETFCHQYYNCWDGRATIEQCPGDLLFNQITSSCDYPEAVNCAGRIRNPAPFISGGRCLKEWGTFPDPLDCTAFYECAHGRAFRKVCPIYTAFDDRYLVCVHAHNVECGGRGGIYGTLSPPIYPVPSGSGSRGAKAAGGGSGISGIGWDRKPQQPASPSQGTYSKGSPIGQSSASSGGGGGGVGGRSQVASSVTWTGSLSGRSGSTGNTGGSTLLGGSGNSPRNVGLEMARNVGDDGSPVIIGSSVSSSSGTGAGREGSFSGTGQGGNPGAGSSDSSFIGTGTGSGSRSVPGNPALGVGGGAENGGSGGSTGTGAGGSSQGSGIRSTSGSSVLAGGLTNAGDAGLISDSSPYRGYPGSLISGITGITAKDIPRTDREKQFEKNVSEEAIFRCPHPRGLYSYPLDCSRFWLCREYRPSLLKCPNGQLFDLASLTCTSPDKAQCSTLTPRT